MPPQPTDSPMTHECRSLTPVDMRQVVDGKNASELMQRALARVGSMNIAVANSMLVVTTMSSDDNGWLMNQIFLPADRPGVSKRVQDRAARFFPAIQKGFARTLTAADLPASVTRDPA